MNKPTRAEFLQAAQEERKAGNTGLASLLAEEADHCSNSRQDNARTARDFPGGSPRGER